VDNRANGNSMLFLHSISEGLEALEGVGKYRNPSLISICLRFDRLIIPNECPISQSLSTKIPFTKGIKVDGRKNGVKKTR